MQRYFSFLYECQVNSTKKQDKFRIMAKNAHVYYIQQYLVDVGNTVRVTYLGCRKSKIFLFDLIKTFPPNRYTVYIM